MGITGALARVFRFGPATRTNGNIKPLKLPAVVTHQNLDQFVRSVEPHSNFRFALNVPAGLLAVGGESMKYAKLAQMARDPAASSVFVCGFLGFQFLEESRRSFMLFITPDPGAPEPANDLLTGIEYLKKLLKVNNYTIHLETHHPNLQGSKTRMISAQKR